MNDVVSFAVTVRSRIRAWTFVEGSEPRGVTVPGHDRLSFRLLSGCVSVKVAIQWYVSDS